MLHTNVPYIHLRGGIYHFRMRVPRSCMGATSQKELTCSLGTDSLKRARDKVLLRYPIIQRLKQMGSKLTPPELKALFKELTDFSDIDSLGRQYHEEGHQTQALTGAIGITDEVRDSLEAGKLYDFSEVTKSQPDTNNPLSGMSFSTLFLALMDARIERMLSGTSPHFLECLEHAKKVLDNYSEEIEEISEPVITLKESWEWWLEHKKKTPETVKNDYRRCYEFMVLRWGEDFSIKNVSKVKIRELLAEFATMPKANKRPYNKMTLEERYELAEAGDVPEEDVLKGSTVQMLLEFIQSLFSYLTNYKEIFSASPTAGVSYEFEDARFGCYSDKECMQLEQAALKEKEHWKKWAILIGLYSGMRLSEIFKALHSGVKISEKGIYYFYVEGGKTASAKRAIPIHKKLLEHGILTTDKDAIPPSAQAVTAFMGKLRENLNIPYLDEYGSRRIFHSLRHSFINRASYSAPNLALVQQLVGHAKDAGITTRYIHEPNFKECLDVVNRVKYSLDN